MLLERVPEEAHLAELFGGITICDVNPTPAQFVAHLAATGRRPAALIGEWFGWEAVVAVDCVPRPVARGTAFSRDDAHTPGHWRFGWEPYSGDAFAADARAVAVFGGREWSAAPGAPADFAAQLPCLVAAAAEAAATHPPADPGVEWRMADTAADGSPGPLAVARAAHERGVLECLDAIRAGEVYQTCLSSRFHGTVAPGTGDGRDAGAAGADAVDVAARWWAVRVAKHSPVRAAFLAGIDGDGRDVVVASLSPEEFLVRDSRVVRESPIKGTVPATADPGTLAASKKDVAENIMIVDLVRHDLGRVAVTGGVRVTELLAVRPAPGVWHLVSEVTATLPEGVPHARLIDACFPPASVTGTPKTRAMELLPGWEPWERGVHCGAIGAACGDRLELNVAIRTAEFRGPGVVSGASAGEDADAGEGPGDDARITVEAGVGGGITIDSDPAGEWAEILAKAAPLVERV